MIGPGHKSSPVVKSLLKDVHYRLVENLARQGLNIDQIADVLELKPKLFEAKISRDERLAKAIHRGKSTPIKQVEESLFRRALGYNYEEFKERIIYKNGQAIHLPIEKTVKHLPSDTKAAELYLTNKSENWKRVNHVNIQGSLTLRDRAGLVRGR